MYLRHFGLDKPLFEDGIARDGAVFTSRSDADALAHAALALTSRDAVIVLHGPAGIGKTTFAATAAGAAGESSRVATAWLNTPALSAYEMLELLLLDFGFDPYKQTRVERLQVWRQFLIEMAATDTRIFVAVEHADDLEPAVLKALAALTAADPNGCPGANLVLMGQDRLVGLLQAPDLAELKQRVRLMRAFRPYDEATVQDYLEHGVRAAGGEFDAVFGAGAVAALRTYTGGIPRVINHVCETALGLTAARGAGRLTAGIVRTAAVEICGVAEPEPAGAAAAAATVAGGVTSLAIRYDAKAPAPLAIDMETTPEPVPAEPDDIPVLTEQVEVDLVPFAPADDSPLSDEAAAADDDGLDQLTPEVVDAILSADDGASDIRGGGPSPDAIPAAARRDGEEDASDDEPPLRLRASA